MLLNQAKPVLTVKYVYTKIQSNSSIVCFEYINLKH